MESEAKHELLNDANGAITWGESKIWSEDWNSAVEGYDIYYSSERVYLKQNDLGEYIVLRGEEEVFNGGLFKEGHFEALSFIASNCNNYLPFPKE